MRRIFHRCASTKVSLCLAVLGFLFLPALPGPLAQELRINQVSLQGSNYVVIQYDAQSNSTYLLLQGSSVNAIHTPVATNSGPAGPAQFIQTIPAAGRESYFRIQRGGPPQPVVLDPASGASEVGVTVRPKATFPKAVVISSLNSNNFFASFAGNKLAATIVPASDGAFAWLFFNPPMPGASQISVTVDGSSIQTQDGSFLDADAGGTPGGVAHFNFSTVSVAPVPGTVVSSRIVDPGPDLIPRTADDVTLGNGYQYLLPIAGVRVHVLGMENNFAFTDTNGMFTLSNMPVGDVKVVLDGRTATNPPAGYYFPEMVMDTTLEPGITNGLMNIVDTNGVVVRDPNGVPIRALAQYLPRVASNVLQTVSAGVTNLITLQSNAAYNLSPTQQQYLTIEIMPNSLIGMDGQPLATGQVGVSVVPPELVKDMLPPGLLQHTFDITVQAPGIATFATPAPMTFPNVFNAPPGTKLSFLSFDHTTGRLVIEGTATVSADGLYVRTDPGTGITHPGWHGLAPPGKNNTPPPPPPPGCSGGSQQCMDRCDTAKEAWTISCDLATGIELWECVPLTAPPAIGVCLGLVLVKHLICDKLCEGIADRCEEYCQGCPGGPSPLAPAQKGNRAFSPANVINAQIRQKYDAIINIISSNVHYGEPVDPGTIAAIRALLSEADEVAGGNARQFLRLQAIELENSLNELSSSIGLLEGNAPPYSVAYVATIHSPSGEFKIRGQTEGLGQYSIFVGSDSEIYDIAFYDPKQRAYGLIFPNLSSTSRYALPRFYLRPVDESFIDTDNDGLPDVAEDVYGTDPNNPDTDGDGVRDGAEIQQGLDPLSGRGFANGVIASLPLPGEAKEVVLEGSILDSQQQTAYLALGSRGLGIVNASQFQKPILLGQLDLPGDATDVAVDSNLRIAAVAANAGGLHLVNVADPMQPALLQTINLNARQVEVIGGVAYVAAGGDLWSFDLASRALLQQLPLGGATLTGLAGEGLFLYTMDSSRVLRAIDLRDGAMTPRDSLTMPAGGGKVFVGNGIAYVPAADSPTGGFATANVSNPAGLTLLSGVDANNIAGRAVVANGSGLAVSVGTVGFGGGGPALDVLNVSDPANTGAFLTRFPMPAEPFSAAIGAGIAFAAGGTTGLQVVNYRSFDNQGVPPTITLSNSFVMLTPTNGVAEEGKLVLVSARTTDDVQVRNVEFYVDGVKVFNDASFPLEYRFITPTLASGKTNLTLRAKATDTGGNFAWSDEIILTLAPDSAPPHVTTSIPRGTFASASTVIAFFNEPMAPGSFTAGSFTVTAAGADDLFGTADDLKLTNGVASYREDNQAAYLVFTGGLSFGSYLARVTTNVTDLAGNGLTTDFTWQFRIAPCLATPPGLGAWWSGDGNAEDNLGTNHGILVNGTSFTTGKAGLAFSFDGTNNYVQVADNAALYPGTNSFTIEAWIKTTRASGQQAIVTRYENGGSGSSGSSVYEFYVTDGKLWAFLRDMDQGGPDNNGQSLTGANFLADGTFHHVALVRDVEASEMRLHVDGTLDAVAAISPGVRGAIGDDDGRPDPFVIGAEQSPQANSFVSFFSGEIDEVAYFSRALTPDEISATHVAGDLGMCKDFPPRVLSFSPTNQAIVLALSNLRVTFNRSIAPETLISGFILTAAGPDALLDTPDDQPVTTGQLIYSEPFKTASLNFTNSLPPGFYRVALSSAVTGVTGLSLENPTSSSFWILPGGLAGDDDFDLLSNGQELALGLNPLNGDTDVDGWDDATEIAAGTDPLTANPSTLFQVASAPVGYFNGVFDRGPTNVFISSPIVSYENQ